ncbi:U3 small nucleolar RNA-associated protein 14 homolog A-like [Argonauta hians]
MDLIITDNSDDDLKEAEISDSEDIKEVQDDKTRKRLIDSVLALNHKKARFNQRTETGKNVSEFNFGASSSLNKLMLEDLLKCVKDKKRKKQLNKTLRNLQGKKNVIKEPLQKHEQEKADRAAGFTKTCEDLSLWDDVVWDNRKKDHLQFPIRNEKVNIFEKSAMTQYFKPQNSLEVEVHKVLHGAKDVPTEGQGLSQVEQKALRAMDLKQARIRRNELMKYRALLNYHEIKQQWKNRIKSKRYRRLLKRDKLEKEKSRVNDLASKDPEKFLEQMKTVEKSRAKERVSLKHRGGSKFQKRQMMYAKYDPNTQQRISEMVKKNRELTRKQVVAVGDSEDEEEEEEVVTDHDDDDGGENNTETMGATTAAGSGNAWMKATRISVKKLRKVPGGDQASVITKEPMDEIPRSLREPMPGRLGRAVPLAHAPPPPAEVSIDPKQVFNISAPLAAGLPSLRTNMAEDEEGEAAMEEEEGGEGEDAKLTLSQAFASDDVIEEFQVEKEAARKAGRPGDIDLTIPGWGEWGGDGCVVSNRKRKRFTKRAPPPKPRKDDPLGHVIIDETRDAAITKYQVKELPFPYRNAADFAATIANPIGKDWNPQTVVQELVKPRVETKLGAIIKPIDRSALLTTTTTTGRDTARPHPMYQQKKHKQRHKRQKKK